MKTNWNEATFTDSELKNILALSDELHISEVLSTLLFLRGVSSLDEAKVFFKATLDDIHNPFLMKDMDVAVDRLIKALQKKEKILIYGDYDVDGTTAVSLVYSFLRKYTNNLSYYIPDRYLEGYGVSYKAIEEAKDSGVTLVIALDCGIKANDKVEKANSYGIDFIICDHHKPGVELPNAVAVLDPQREDCNYPYSYLSGCGVGFKLMQAFCIRNNIPERELFDYLDILAVSIASDIVPITGENRILAKYGLDKLNKNPGKGLLSIKKICHLENRDITISDVVFSIGPRINAAGRLYSGMEVVKLLVANDMVTLKTNSLKIDGYNTERKEIDKSVTDDAIEQFINQKDYKDKKSIVLYNPSWNKGIVGIVASRVAERFCRPTIILTDGDDGFVSGSGRSVVGFDLYLAIDSCSDLLTNFGGHTYAAGLTIQKENLDEFIRRFDNYVNENILPEQLIHQIDIDTTIDFKDITPKFLRLLKRMAPFGPDNNNPVFITRNVYDYRGWSKLIGKDFEHAKLALSQNSKKIFNAIAFKSGYMSTRNMSDVIKHLKSGQPIDICYSIKESFFNGHNYIQLMVKDIMLR